LAKVIWARGVQSPENDFENEKALKRAIHRKEQVFIYLFYE
jgi:hypothetical protein